VDTERPGGCELFRATDPSPPMEPPAGPLFGYSARHAGPPPPRKLIFIQRPTA
jgi:hypothetical protein